MTGGKRDASSVPPRIGWGNATRLDVAAGNHDRPRDLLPAAGSLGMRGVSGSGCRHSITLSVDAMSMFLSWRLVRSGASPHARTPIVTAARIVVGLT